MNRIQYSNVKTLTPLSDEALHRLAPAAFAERPDSTVSTKYRQVKTTDVIEILRDRGWSPVQAIQRNTRTDEDGNNRAEVTKHMIRFSMLGDGAQALTVGDSVVQAVLTNSHDRSSAFVFMLGVFRLICSNGMMVNSGSFDAIHVRHTGFDPRQVVRASAHILESGKGLAERIHGMQSIQLEQPERLAFARAAAGLLMSPEEGRVDTERLLSARRYGDRDRTDLWSTMNTIQENMIKGGVPALRQDDEGPIIETYAAPKSGRKIPVRYRRVHLQAVRGLDRDIRLNQSLWALTEEMRKIKTGQQN